MPQFPPPPTWESFHPLVIHFPIVLLLLTPLLVLTGACMYPGKARPLIAAGLVTLLLGTGSLFVAASTGEAAAQLTERNGRVDVALKTHADLAAETEMIFSALSIILLGIVALPKALGREETRLTGTWMPLAFLVLYCAGILSVVNTAHSGARLVHEFGVRAIIPAENDSSKTSPTAAQPQSTGGKQIALTSF